MILDYAFGAGWLSITSSFCYQLRLLEWCHNCIPHTAFATLGKVFIFTDRSYLQIRSLMLPSVPEMYSKLCSFHCCSFLFAFFFLLLNGRSNALNIFFYLSFFLLEQWAEYITRFAFSIPVVFFKSIITFGGKGNSKSFRLLSNCRRSLLSASPSLTICIRHTPYEFFKNRPSQIDPRGWPRFVLL